MGAWAPTLTMTMTHSVLETVLSHRIIFLSSCALLGRMGGGHVTSLHYLQVHGVYLNEVLTQLRYYGGNFRYHQGNALQSRMIGKSTP